MSTADEVRAGFERVRIDLLPKRRELHKHLSKQEWKKAAAVAAALGGPLPRGQVVSLDSQRGRR